jgi:hypothetical protein
MPQSEARVLQIVPHLPGTFDGVGDYALTLADRLRARHRLNTRFLVAEPVAARDLNGFELVSPLDAQSAQSIATDCSGVILHYVNYAFQPRGVPSALLRFVAGLREHLSGRLVTMFHELYASGRPWQSAFWLRPWQVRIATNFMRLSDVCFVSNEVIAREIQRRQPGKSVRVVPIMSNFGEPQIDPQAQRDPHLWAICGGTALIVRSLRELGSRLRRIPKWCTPERVELIGGRSTDELRKLIEQVPIEFEHYPEISPNAASQLLRRCCFGWIDYYGPGTIWPGMIFKSGSFAACCAHAVIPVLAHDEPPLHLHGDFLPGPFFVTASSARIPAESQLPQTREQIYRWHHRHAGSEVTARAYADALR